jgi:small subunit ribosomal protein S3
MIEKKFVNQKIKEFQIEEFISQSLKNVGHSYTKLQRTPLGEKIIIYASRPGLIVGRKGESIKNLTIQLKEKFKLDNPQIEIQEVENINLDAQIVAEKIASTLERFGTSKFKGIGHKVMESVMDAGALGIEVLISGKIPGARAKRWRFYTGYLKKCGDFAITGVKVAYVDAQLKTGTIGVQVRIMPPDLILPDNIKIKTKEDLVIEKNQEENQKKESEISDKDKKPKKKLPAKKKSSTKKKIVKKKVSKKKTE